MKTPSAPSRAITSGPGYHWFGYYDKLQFDPSNTLVLSMRVGFEGRSPRPEDTVEIGVIDLSEGPAWTKLGSSSAWCWQQGCMLQWIPGSDSSVIWNDREGGRFVSHILDTRTGTRATVPHPIYALSPKGDAAVTTDFRRVNDMRTGYGYAGIRDPNRDVLAPDDSGVWRIDLATGRAEMILSIADVARIPYPKQDLSGAKHYFNHLLVNPSGDRFVFLHRWRFGDGGFATRMITANQDGSDIRVVDDSGRTSHFCWRDPVNILAFTRPEGRAPGFYLFNERTAEMELVLDNPNDGHCLYLPDRNWIVNDSYPSGPERKQQLYLYHIPTRRRVDLGEFVATSEYTGEWRCDLHPRISNDGRWAVIDSAHGGNGRQQYIVDIGDSTTEPTDPGNGE